MNFVIDLLNLRSYFQEPPIVVHPHTVVEPTSSAFEKIGVFSDIYAPRNIAISEDTVFVLAVTEPNICQMSIRDRPQPSLMHLNFMNGEPIWKRMAINSDTFVIDSNRIFVETKAGFWNGAGVAAYDLKSGDKMWQTEFDAWYAIRVGHLTIKDKTLTARTNHRSNEALYILDKATGEIITSLKNDFRVFMIEYDPSVVYEVVDEVIKVSGSREWTTNLGSHIGAITVVDNVLLATFSYYKRIYADKSEEADSCDCDTGPAVVKTGVAAVDKTTGSILWRIEEGIASNIAASSSMAYFLTEEAQLTVVDTRTGETLGKLSFEPSFSISPYVAVDSNIVAVYFDDSCQLFLLRFKPSL